MNIFLTILLSCKDTGSGLAFDHLPHQLELILQWTKISSLEIDIFNLKMMVKSSDIDFLFQNSTSPFRVAAA